MRTTLRVHRTDAFVCLLLAAASATYLMLRRWPLGQADESYYFYHAIRMLEGEVLYRDVFELTTPFLMDVLALAFHVFGTTFNTGRAVGSVIQALLIVAIYSGVRAVGAGRALAVAVAMVHLAIGQPAWPYTTPHWLAVLLVCVLLIISLDRQRARTAGWIVVQGLLLGLLIATRQHSGIAVGMGMTLLTLADALDDRIWGRAQGLPLCRHLVMLAVATLAGSGLVLGPHLIQAGIEQMLNQLVMHPLTGYHGTMQTTWGTSYLLEHTPYTWPVLLKYLPAAVAVTALRAAAALLRHNDRRAAESLLVLAVFGASAIAYSMSFPDLTHLALIMPVMLIVVAELLASGLRAAGRRGGGAETILGLVLIIACTAQLQRNYTGALAQHQILYDTQFGTLPFATSEPVEYVEWVKGAVGQNPGSDLLCYPGYAAMYLMSGARNPTRHELAFPKYQSDEEIQGLVDTLERKRVKHVLLVPPLIREPDDPVATYVAQHYRCSDKGLLRLCTRHDGG